MNELKKCSKCNVEKTLHFFFKGKNNTWCKECKYQWSRDRYNKQKPIDNKYMNAKRNYGIDRDTFDKLMRKKQCSICKVKFKELKDIKIDHCHNSGIVRDVLCSRCNTVLGMLNENIDLFDSFSKYIDKYKHLKDYQ